MARKFFILALLFLLTLPFTYGGCGGGGGGGGDDEFRYNTSKILKCETNGYCQGCCSWHGGVACYDQDNSGGWSATTDLPVCADGTPMSDTCVNKSCNSCFKCGEYAPDPSIPSYCSDLIYYGAFSSPVKTIVDDFEYTIDNSGWIDFNCSGRCVPPSQLIVPVKWGLNIIILPPDVSGALLDEKPVVRIRVDDVWYIVNITLIKRDGWGEYRYKSDNQLCSKTVSCQGSYDSCLQTWPEENCKPLYDRCMECKYVWYPVEYTFRIEIPITWEADAYQPCNDYNYDNDPFPYEFYRVQEITVNDIPIDLSSRLY